MLFRSIRAEAFKNQTQITGIVIPESITSVASTAFSGCTNIQSATIPTWCIGSISKDKLKAVVLNGGTSIRDYAFQYCRSLTSIEIPASVTSIGNSAFYGCSSLTSVTFAENSQLTIIGDEAFLYCDSLTSIDIPTSVTSIGDFALDFSGEEYRKHWTK